MINNCITIKHIYEIIVRYMLGIIVLLESVFINIKRIAKDSILKIKVLLSEYAINEDNNEKVNILVVMLAKFLCKSRFKAKMITEKDNNSKTDEIKHFVKRIKLKDIYNLHYELITDSSFFLQLRPTGIEKSLTDSLPKVLS